MSESGLTFRNEDFEKIWWSLKKYWMSWSCLSIVRGWASSWTRGSWVRWRRCLPRLRSGCRLWATSCTCPLCCGLRAASWPNWRCSASHSWMELRCSTLLATGTAPRPRPSALCSRCFRRHTCPWPSLNSSDPPPTVFYCPATFGRTPLFYREHCRKSLCWFYQIRNLRTEFKTLLLRWHNESRLQDKIAISLFHRTHFHTSIRLRCWQLWFFTIQQNCV